jgi:hypothetical protein
MPPGDDGKPIALADFLAAQDSDNVALVAQRASDGAAHALAAFTADVNVSVLLAAFDLLPYDGLLPAEQFTELMEAAEACMEAEHVQQVCMFLCMRKCMREYLRYSLSQYEHALHYAAIAHASS